jgi:hypothetical protein
MRREMGLVQSRGVEHRPHATHAACHKCPVEDRAYVVRERPWIPVKAFDLMTLAL